MAAVSIQKGTSNGERTCVLLVEGVLIPLKNTDKSKIVTDKVFLRPTKKERIFLQNKNK